MAALLLLCNLVPLSAVPCLFVLSVQIVRVSLLIVIMNFTLAGSILAEALERKLRFAPAARRGVDPIRWGGFLKRFALPSGMSAAGSMSWVWIFPCRVCLTGWGWTETLGSAPTSLRSGARTGSESVSDQEPVAVAPAPLRRGGRARDLVTVTRKGGETPHESTSASFAESQRERSGWDIRVVCRRWARGRLGGSLSSFSPYFQGEVARTRIRLSISDSFAESGIRYPGRLSPVGLVR